MTGNEELPLVSIQILNWNRAEETLRAIRSAKEQTYRKTEIVVIDNGSEDKSVELIEKYHPKIKLIKLDENYGCPGGRNRGVKYCEGKYIFYVDNDGVLHRKAVELAVKSIMKNEKIKIVTGKVLPFKDEDEIDTNFKVEGLFEERLTRTFQGGICLHDKDIYKKVGMYPDNYMYGGEEDHLAIRIVAEGYHIIQNPSIVLWHIQSNVARDQCNELVQAYINRLNTVYELYPMSLVFLFLIKYVFYYTYLSIKAGFGFLFIERNFKELPPRIKNSKRNAIPLNKIKYYHNLPMYSK